MTGTIIKKNKTLKSFGHHLRKNQTLAESRLWYYLRNREFFGHKFRRQHLINRYVVDFICLEKKLVVEVDGGQHSLYVNYDNERSLFLENLGYTVLRFWNNEVLCNIEGVLHSIKAVLER